MFRPGGRIRSAERVVIVTAAIALVAAVAAYAAPMPHAWQYGWALYHETLVLTSAFMCLLLGAVVLFLMGADAYKAELRKAYVAICIGITCVALGCVQLPVLSIFNQWGSAWVGDGGAGLPFFLAGIITYYGVRRLALLIGHKHWLTRFRVTLPVVLALCGAMAFVPHVKVGFAELDFDIAYGIFVWSAGFCIIATILLFGIKRRIGAHYTAAMAWLATGITVVSIALVLAIVGGFVSNKTQDYWSVAIDAAGLAAGILLMKAGYTFVGTREF